MPADAPPMKETIERMRQVEQKMILLRLRIQYKRVLTLAGAGGLQKNETPRNVVYARETG